MGNLEVTLDIPQWLSGDVFGRILSEELYNINQTVTGRLLRGAQHQYHRYRRLTGNLRRSTIVTGSLGDEDGFKLWVDLNQAEYGKYIIRGHGSWDPDPFLDKTVDASREWIIQQVRDAVDRVIGRMQ